MRRFVLALLACTLLAPAPAYAARRAQPEDWERFLATQPVPASGLIRWLGWQPKPEPEVGPPHFLINDPLLPYSGGIDLYTNKDKEVVEALFYFVRGPIYTDHDVAVAGKLDSGYTLDDAKAWYGEPDEQGTLKRTNATSWTYTKRGPCRGSITFHTFPGQRSLHRIIASRE